MAFELTVKQCAELLGTTEARVYQLINDGLLPAEKIAGRYFIDDGAAHARAASHPRPGRPKTHKTEAVLNYTLMNREYPVFDFSYDRMANEFVTVPEVHDKARAPFGLISSRGKKVSLSAFTSWWAHRSIPMSREGMDSKLAALGVADPSQIPFRSLGLSLSDQYWFKPLDAAIEWQDVNFFTNDFPELSQDDWLSHVGLRSPDNTSEGQLSKQWIQMHGKPALVKGGSPLNQEPYNEVVASALHKCLLHEGEYVEYNLFEKIQGKAACISFDFLTDEEEYIPAYSILKAFPKHEYRSDYQHYCECCWELGVDDIEQHLSKMIVCDDIIGNNDRHWRNFGLIRNVQTLSYRVAPLFDSGSSLWCYKTESELRNGDFGFTTKPFFDEPNRQLRLVNDYSWFRMEALEGFSDEAVNILAQNPALEKRLDPIKHAIEARINRIQAIL